MLKPLIKWSGGKGNEIKNFFHHLPTNFDLYIEPFVGGGALYFNLEFSGENVIADVHEELVNFYAQISLGNTTYIHNIVRTFELTEEAYYFVRDKFVSDNKISQAARFYYLRKTAYRGMLRYNSKGGFNIPWGRYKSVKFSDILNPRYTELLQRTGVRLASFDKIFEEFNDNKFFMFLDPPYDSEFTDYGYCSFGREEQEKLAECFKSTKTQCLMVIGETDFIRDLYKDYIVDSYHKKYQFKLHSGRIDDKIDNTHLIIRNY